ncbi:hypothetical protein B0H11DRAFT_1941019 [Mycena galericulata]|nr:hypothetical protein B0H11DRAFT_1941019 [Mycena galericulata]
MAWLSHPDALQQAQLVPPYFWTLLLLWTFLSTIHRHHRVQSDPRREVFEDVPSTQIQDWLGQLQVLSGRGAVAECLARTASGRVAFGAPRSSRTAALEDFFRQFRLSTLAFPWIHAQFFWRGIRIPRIHLCRIGFFLSTFIGARPGDRMYRYLDEKNGGKGTPEMRIPALFIGSLFVPVGLLHDGHLVREFHNP